MTSTTEPCPYCAEPIRPDAKKCKHCGEYLDAALREQAAKDKQQLPPVRMQTWNPGTAALLSLIFPGAGQIYRGKILEGFLWLGFVVVGYIFVIVPGLILHILCVVDAKRPIQFGKD